MKQAFGYILWAALYLSCCASSAQQQQSFKHQLELIDSLRQFANAELKLTTGKDFYRQWNNSGDSMYTYLYISDTDKIHVPVLLSSISGKSYTADSAQILSNQFKYAGYETLIYKTAGNSNARLNEKLLSYPDEAIAFIIFHEATHRHLHSGTVHLIPYEYEEAFCDAVANRACNLFAAKTAILSRHCVKLQAHCFEAIYKLLNNAQAGIDNLPAAQHKQFLNNCTLKVWGMAEKGNRFIKDRMQYPVNHAYFIRTIAYTKHYFEIKKWLGQSIDVRYGVEQIALRFKPKTAN